MEGRNQTDKPKPEPEPEEDVEYGSAGVKEAEREKRGSGMIEK